MNTAAVGMPGVVGSAQTIAELFDLSKRMHDIAAEVSAEAELGQDVAEWHAAADTDIAAFNALHNL